MALDGLFLHFLKNEIEKELIGARLEKLHQPTKSEFVFSFKNRQSSSRLLISASGNCPRVHFTSSVPENPMKPPMLCMLFRKHLSGAILTGISQAGMDRVLLFEFDASNEIGDRVKRTVAVELTAQYSNIILIDGDGDIIDSVKRVDLLKSSVRQVLPGMKYVLPPIQNKPSIDSISNGELFDILRQNPASKLSVAIQHSMLGASMLLARELAYRATGSDCPVSQLSEQMYSNLGAELDKLRIRLKTCETTPNSFSDKDAKPLDFYYMPVTMYDGEVTVTNYGSLSHLLDSFYSQRERIVRAKAKADDLFKLLNGFIERISKKINNQLSDLKATQDRDKKRIFAELINANLYRLPKGAAWYDIENYYDNGNTVRVPADPRLSPSLNAQKYFKEYRKAQTAEKILTEQISNAEQELDYLNSVLDSLSRADSQREFDAIREELREQGYLRRHDRKKEKKPAAMPPIEYTTPDGFKILVGRNNVQNDSLTFKLASKNDIWFHTQKIHGSHVILVTDGREPTNEAMECAAATAAYHSSASSSKLVPVDYSQVKNIKKPNGAKPGFVIYHIYKTIIIDPALPAENSEG